MPDYADIYQNHAGEYEQLISREDYKGRLFWALEKLVPFEGLNVVEFGAGTGRLTRMLAPLVQTIRAYDSSEAMLAVAVEKLKKSGLTNWYTETGDHRNISAEDDSADVVISGWSLCYLALDSGEAWREELNRGLEEMQRVAHTNGDIIIVETLGTGSEKPNPPANLLPYFDFLQKKGFKRDWVRTDYLFRDRYEAEALTRFFFGDGMVEKIRSIEDGIVLPECTGIWWRKRNHKLF